MRSFTAIIVSISLLLAPAGPCLMMAAYGEASPHDAGEVCDHSSCSGSESDLNDYSSFQLNRSHHIPQCRCPESRPPALLSISEYPGPEFSRLSEFLRTDPPSAKIERIFSAAFHRDESLRDDGTPMILRTCSFRS